jgi:hypothetical protein
VIQLAHEVWKDSTGFTYCLPRPPNDALFAVIEPDAEVIHVIYAGSWVDAMIQYNQWQGFGRYEPIPDVADAPYSEQQLREQMALRPSYYPSPV